MESKWIVRRSSGQVIYRTSSEEDALWHAGRIGAKVIEVNRESCEVWLDGAV